MLSLKQTTPLWPVVSPQAGLLFAAPLLMLSAVVLARLGRAESA